MKKEQQMTSCLGERTEDEKDEDGKGCNQLLVSSRIVLLGDGNCPFGPGSRHNPIRVAHGGDTEVVGRSCTGQGEGRRRVKDEKGEGVHERKKTKMKKDSCGRCTSCSGCDGGCGVMSCVGGGCCDHGCGCYCCCCCVGCGSCRLTSVV